jgi:single-strand DNA-binding protein
MNKFELVGRLTQDVILKQSASGKDYGYINIAVARRGGDATDFIDITIFDATARFASKYFRRGSWVSVVGRIDASTYEKDGQKVYGLRLVGDELGFCGYNKSGDAPQGINTPAVDSNDFAFSETITATDDNLPF